MSVPNEVPPMTRTSLITLATGALLALTASPAVAGPNEDYTGVKRNWTENNQVITPCRFTEAQLANAGSVSYSVPDDNYTSFRNAVGTEWQRVKNGGCVTVRPGVSVLRNSKVRLTASPATIVAGKTKRFTFTATTVANGKRQAIMGATVTFAGSTLKTDKGGRVRVSKKFAEPGRQRATVALAGLKPGKANVQVTRPAKKRKKK